MATITKTKSGTWRAEARVNKNGKRVFREIRHFDTRREAEGWGRETEARVKQTLETGRALPTEVSLRQAMEQWEADTQAFIEDAPPLLKKSREFAALVSSFAKGKSRRKHWAEDARLGNKALRSITQLDLEIHIDDRRDDEISGSTIYKDLDMLIRGMGHKFVQVGIQAHREQQDGVHARYLAGDVSALSKGKTFIKLNTAVLGSLVLAGCRSYRYCRGCRRRVVAGAIADKIEHLLYEWSQRPEGLFDGAKEAEESLSKLIDPLEKMDIGMLLCLDTELANGLVSALSHLQFLKRVLDSADEDADVWIDHRHRRALSIHLDEARQELNWVRSKIAQI